MLGAAILVGVAAIQVALTVWDHRFFANRERSASGVLWVLSMLAIPVVAMFAVWMVEYWIDSGPPRSTSKAYGLVIVALLGYLIARLGAAILVRKKQEQWLMVGALLLAGLTFAVGAGSISVPSFLFFLFALALLGVGATFPTLAADAWSERAPTTMAVAIVAMALFVPQVVFAVPAFIPQTILFETGPARHLWSVEIEPQNATEPYAVLVPFLVARGSTAELEPNPREYAEEARGTRAVQPLGHSLRVATGLATMEWNRTSGYLEVSGTGPVWIEAKHIFYGSIGDREAFHDMVAPSRQIYMVEGKTSVDVTWTFDMGGGTGHTCWQEYTLQATVPAGSNAPLAGEIEGGTCA